MSWSKRGKAACVFAATSTALRKLSAEIGLPLCLVDAATDPAIAVARLNERLHGCARRWPGSFQPLLIEPGWDDWRLSALDELGCDGPEPLGMTFREGRIEVLLQPGATMSAFRRHLASALHQVRLQEITISPGYLEERCGLVADMVVHPRYTPPRAAEGDFRDAVLCQDLYALAPAEHARQIAWCAVEAGAEAARSLA